VHRIALALFALLLGALSGCGDTDRWPDWTEERSALQSPTAPLRQESLPDLWSQLVHQIHEIQALAVPPLLGDAVDLPLGNGAGDGIGEDVIDFRTESATMDCPNGGKARFERTDDVQLEDRLRVLYQDCRYSIMTPSIVVPQQLSGTAYIDVAPAGQHYLRFDGELYVEGHRREASTEYTWSAAGITVALTDGQQKVLARVDMPGTGLAGTVVITATNGTFECQTDSDSIYCVDVASGASLEAPWPIAE
jgi:hypothetical protein